MTKDEAALLRRVNAEVQWATGVATGELTHNSESFVAALRAPVPEFQEYDKRAHEAMKRIVTYIRREANRLHEYACDVAAGGADDTDARS